MLNHFHREQVWKNKPSNIYMITFLVSFLVLLTIKRIFQNVKDNGIMEFLKYIFVENLKYMTFYMYGSRDLHDFQVRILI